MKFYFGCEYCVLCTKTITDDNSISKYKLKPICYPIYAPLFCICTTATISTCCWCICCYGCSFTDYCMLNCYEKVLGNEFFWNIDDVEVTPQSKVMVE